MIEINKESPLTDDDPTGTREEFGSLFRDMAARTCPEHKADLRRRLLRLSATADDIPAALCAEFYPFVPGNEKRIFEMIDEIWTTEEWKPNTCAEVISELSATLQRMPNAD